MRGESVGQRPGANLLTTKLSRPRVPPTYVDRARIAAMLNVGTLGPLTCVSAGAGWGKTLTTAAWADAGPQVGPVAWLSLDETDNEARVFWSYILAALRGAAQVPASNAITGLDPGLGRPDENLRRLISGLSSLPTPVVLVLDDFHLIRDHEVLAGVASLLARPIDQLRLVLLTRADPDLPIHRLRLSGDLVEIRSRDLAFDVVEASSLLAHDGIPMDRDQSRRIVGRTEGWPAGLRLAALFLSRGGPDHTAANFTGDDRAVVDYLLEEVLASQTPELQRFLLRTSVVERVCSDLAEVLSGVPGGQRTLETLERANAFVVGLGADRRWFRYHPLLREMLQHQLSVEDPGTAGDLHARAARWLAGQGHLVDSLRHAIAASDWDLFGEVFVSRAAPMLVSAERVSLGQVLATVPVEHFTDTPDLALCGAGLSLFRGQVLEMQGHLAYAEDRLSHLPHGQHVNTAIALQLLKTAPARGNGDMQALMTGARAALELLADLGLGLPAAPEFRAVALGNLGVGLVWTGQIEDARGTLEEALAAVEDTRLEVTKIAVLGHLALVSVSEGRLHEGAAHATAAIELLEARGWAPLPQAAVAYLALALVRVERNEMEATLELLRLGRCDTTERAAQFGITLAQIRLDASEHRVDRARGELARLLVSTRDWTPPMAVMAWLRVTEAEVDLAAGDPSAAIERLRTVSDSDEPQVRLCLARALMMAGELAEADAVLEPLRPLSGPDPAGVTTWLLTALIADHRREDSGARDALGRALACAAPERIRRPFLMLSPERLPRLLSHYLTTVEGTDPFVTELVRELPEPRAPGTSSRPMLENLTDRELSVLRRLPAMMTNAEIAEELYISVNTVKAHLKQIFTKLEVTSRREAVNRARELDLLGR